MGNCCQRVNQIEVILNIHFKNIKVRFLDYESAKSTLELKLYRIELNEEIKAKFCNNKSNSNNFLTMITKENFMRLYLLFLRLLL